MAAKKRAPPKAPSPSPPDVGPRERMVAGAARLLATRGLQGTSFAEVLDLTQAPRGSIYHHFPGGKDQLVRAALDFAEAQMVHYLAPRPGAPALEVVELFLRIWRAVLTRSELKAGCAIVAVTVAADSSELLAHTAAIFRSWRVRLAEMLLAGGLSADEAPRFAALLIAASEGAVVLARAEQSLEPFELVAATLVDQVKRASRRYSPDIRAPGRRRGEPT